MSKAWKLVLGGVLVALVSGGAAWAARGGSPRTDQVAALDGSIVSQFDSGGASSEGWRPHPFLGRLTEAHLGLFYDGQEHQVTVVHGSVQSVSAASITLRELNGKEMSVPVNADTRVRLNRHPARLSDIKPGDVAFTFQEGTGPARLVIAFEPRGTAGV